MASEWEKAKGSTVDAEETDPELIAKLAEARAKQAEIDRDNGMQTHIHRLSVCGVYIIGALVILAVAVWLLHFILPTDKRFLTDAQVSDLQKVLFSGFVGGVIAGQSKRLLK